MMSVIGDMRVDGAGDYNNILTETRDVCSAAGHFWQVWSYVLMMD